MTSYADLQTKKALATADAAVVPQHLAAPPVSPLPSPRPATAEDLGKLSDDRKMYIEVKDNKISVVFTGTWDGRFIKAAIREIEHGYKVIKHNMTRKVVQENAAAKRKAEAILQPVINKGA